MKEFVTQLFLQSGFTLHTNAEEALLFTNNEQGDKRSYWLLLEREQATLLEEQISLFIKFKALIGEKDFDKNCSLLLLLKRPAPGTEPEHKREVLLIEDNPFYFKKYVLCYTLKELEEFTAARNNRHELNFLEKEMVSRACFSVYKKGPQAENWQSLVFRLSLKIPFINVKTEVKPGLSALFDDNDQILATKHLNTLDTAVNSFVFGKSTEEISNTAPLELLTALNLNQQHDGEQAPSDQDPEL